MLTAYMPCYCSHCGPRSVQVALISTAPSAPCIPSRPDTPDSPTGHTGLCRRLAHGWILVTYWCHMCRVIHLFAGSCVDRIFYERAQSLSTDYRSLGKRLNVSPDFVSGLEDDYDKDETRAKFEIMARWYDTKMEKPGFFEIYETLRDVPQSPSNEQGGYMLKETVSTSTVSMPHGNWTK